MSLSTEGKRRFCEQLAAFSDAAISVEQLHDLHAIVKTDAEACRLYVEHLLLDALLNWSLDKEVAPVQFGETEMLHQDEAVAESLSRGWAWPVSPARAKRGPRLSSSARFAAIAATVLLVGYFVTVGGLLVLDHVRRGDDDQRIAARPAAQLPALLTNADDAEWVRKPTGEASEAPGQSLQVRTGLAELRFAQGAKVVLSGPAEFEVLSANRGFLRRGKIVAVVPPQAIGFTIATPTAEIVDLGTEFGVEVDEQQNAEVHVFTGVVVARPTEAALNRKEVRVMAGKALRIDGQQAKYSSIPANPKWRSDFVKGSTKRRLVALQNPTAAFSQSGYPVSDTLDGKYETGWAILGGIGANQQAVWETVTDVGEPGGTSLMFTLAHAISAQHGIGKFRLSVTTDDRDAFANGLPTEGQVAANWKVLTPLAVISNGGETFEIKDDNTILVGGANPASTTYTITAKTTLTGITGIRLETFTDAGFTAGGPGRYRGTGNFGLSEFRVEAMPLATPKTASDR